MLDLPVTASAIIESIAGGRQSISAEDAIAHGDGITIAMRDGIVSNERCAMQGAGGTIRLTDVWTL